MTFNTSPTTRIGYRPGFVAIALTTLADGCRP